MKNKTVAIVLAAGSGNRMNSNTPKQYMDLGGKPLIYYSLHAFETSMVDEIILVVGENEIEYNKEHIIDKYHFTKVNKVVAGGLERYLSVYNGLKAIDRADYVLIHDGARPFLSTKLIERLLEELQTNNACVVGVPSKDTIKIVNDKNIIKSTPNRKNTWIVQTPQAFSYDLIMKSYNKIIEELKILDEEDVVINITDDAMVVEHTTNHPVKLVEGSYTNIKITTPEDIIVGNALIDKLY